MSTHDTIFFICSSILSLIFGTHVQDKSTYYPPPPPPPSLLHKTEHWISIPLQVSIDFIVAGELWCFDVGTCGLWRVPRIARESWDSFIKSCLSHIRTAWVKGEWIRSQHRAPAQSNSSHVSGMYYESIRFELGCISGYADWGFRGSSKYFPQKSGILSWSRPTPLPSTSFTVSSPLNS
jgi:hypothetical protein